MPNCFCDLNLFSAIPYKCKFGYWEQIYISGYCVGYGAARARQQALEKSTEGSAAGERFNSAVSGPAGCALRVGTCFEGTIQLSPSGVISLLQIYLFVSSLLELFNTVYQNWISSSEARGKGRIPVVPDSLSGRQATASAGWVSSLALFLEKQQIFLAIWDQHRSFAQLYWSQLCWENSVFGGRGNIDAKFLFYERQDLYSRLIQLVVPALQYITYPSDLEKKRAMFDLHDKPHVTSLLLSHIMDFLLLTYRQEINLVRGGRMASVSKNTNEKFDSFVSFRNEMPL